MQLVKKKRGRPKMAAKDKKVPITIMVKATMAKRLRQTFKKMADQPTYSIKGVVKLNDNVEIDRDLNSAINIMKRYYDNHLASMTEPLDYSNVIMNFNVCNNHSPLGKPIVL